MLKIKQRTISHNLKLQPFTSADLPYIFHLQPEGWPSILPSFEFYTANDFCTPIKYVDANKVVAIGSSILHDGTGWLAHIIVDKDFRNQGIGTLITQSLMEHLHKYDVKTMLLIATPLGEPVYHKLGFEKETVYMFLRDGKTVSPSLNLFSPFQEKHIDNILKLDELISGERRRKLLEPHFANTLVASDNDDITGFFMPTLGEGFIVATTPDIGKQFLMIKHSKTNTTSIPIDNQSAIKFLMENGFVEYRKAVRMWYGEKLSWQPDKLFGRIGGNLG